MTKFWIKLFAVELALITFFCTGKEAEPEKTLQKISSMIMGKSYWEVDHTIRANFLVSKTIIWRPKKDINAYHWNLVDGIYCIEVSFDFQGKSIGHSVRNKPTIYDLKEMFESKAKNLEILRDLSINLKDYDPLKMKDAVNYFIDLGESDTRLAIVEYIKLNKILRQGDNRAVLFLTKILFGHEASEIQIDQKGIGGRSDMIVYSLMLNSYPIYLKNGWPLLLEINGDCVEKYDLLDDIDKIIKNGRFMRESLKGSEQLLIGDDTLINGLPSDCKAFVQRQISYILRKLEVRR